MTWVKVCGLTRREDVEAAVEAGADAVGFVLAPGTPRRVDVEQARRLGRDLPVVRVVVTVDLPPDEVLLQVKEAGAEGVQLHGRHASEAAAAAVGAGYLVLRPVRVRDRVDLSEIPEGQIPLLDAYRRGLHGGTGQRFDWGLIDPGLERRYVLAGGLGPDSVRAAVARLRPWGVDATSRLEVSPGVKDPAKVAAFVREAKQA
ncbi:MAG: phosphoribosylanthranilate isomerase [Acidimicrobiia bacterium]